MDSSHLLLSATATGLIVGLCCTPLDVIKNFWQFNPGLAKRRTSTNLLAVASQIYSIHGTRGFWTGLSPTLLLMVPSNVLFFYFYEILKTSDPIFLASVKARAISVVAVAPLEFIRTKVQADISRNSWSMLSQCIQQEGFRSLWRGVAPTLIRDIPFSAIYWHLNEKFRHLLRTGDREYEKRSNLVKNFLYPFVSGAGAGAMSCIATHPFDIIKTNLQAADRITRARGHVFVVPDNSFKIAGRIYANEGFRGFFVGLSPRLVKLIPACAVGLSTYEFTRHTLSLQGSR